MDSYGGPERRKFPRLEANFVISYKIEQLPPDDEGGEILQGHDLSQTKNVSQGGVLITTNQLFKKGSYLAMVIRFPLLPQKIEVTGEVVDSREIVKNLIYETRVRFVGLDENFFEKLGAFIEKNLR